MVRVTLSQSSLLTVTADVAPETDVYGQATSMLQTLGFAMPEGAHVGVNKAGALHALVARGTTFGELSTVTKMHQFAMSALVTVYVEGHGTAIDITCNVGSPMSDVKAEFLARISPTTSPAAAALYSVGANSWRTPVAQGATTAGFPNGAQFILIY